MWRFIGVILVICGLSGQVRGDVISADMLRATCSYQNLPEEVKPTAKQICHTTIRAYLEYNSAMRVVMKSWVPFCLAEGGSSLVGARSTFLGFVAANSELKQESAAVVFMMAMGEVSRCQ